MDLGEITIFSGLNSFFQDHYDRKETLYKLMKKLEDLNKKMEDGTAQLKQIVDSGELQKGLTDASEELSNVLKSGAVQTGLKNSAENSKLGSINKFASICLGFSDEQEISINEINEIIFGEYINKIINKLNIICII